MSKVVVGKNEDMGNGYTLEQYTKLWMNEIRDDIFDYCSTEDVDKQLHEVIKMMAQIWNEENNK